MNNFKLNSENFDFTTSKAIKINLSNIPKDTKIVDAVLSVKIQSVTANSEIPVHYAPIGSTSSQGWNNVDKIILSADDTLKINISDELQDALLRNATHLQLTFDVTSIIFAEDADSAYVNIDYVSLAEFQSNGSEHKIDLGKSGQASVNLATGELSLSVPLVNTDDNVLPLSISATYHSVKNNKIPAIGMPTNWSLNVNQFLIKETDADGDLQFTYIDENGKSQIIEEKYFYTKDGEEIQVPRITNEEKDANSDTNLGFAVDLDGNYIFRESDGVDETGNQKYKEYPIETKLIAPSGLKLVSSIADITGATLVDHEPEELINVKNNIKSITENIESLQDSINTNKQQILLAGLSKYIINKQLQNEDLARGTSKFLNELDTVNQYICSPCFDENNTNEKNAKYYLRRCHGKIPANHLDIIKKAKPNENGASELFSLDAEGNYIAFDKAAVYKIKEVFYQNYNSLYHLGADWEYDEDDIAGNAYSYKLIQGLNDELSKLMYEDEHNKQSIKELVCDETSLGSYEDLTSETSSCRLLDSDFENFWSYNNGVCLGYKDIVTLDVQIKHYIETNKKYAIKIDEYNETLKKLLHQQELYEMQVPVHYLYNDSNVIYGFGKTSDNGVFRLILITDAYENTIFISYDSLQSNKIKSITDAADRIIAFEYDDENDYLKTLIDSRERKTTFVVSDNLLKEISHDGQRTLFEYDNGCIKGILCPSGKGTKFTCVNNQIVEAQAISVIESIEHDLPVYKSCYLTDNKTFVDCLIDDSKVCFSYNNYKSTSITNTKNKKVTYLFDKYGKVKTIYENTYTGNIEEFNPEEFATNVTDYNYENDKITLKVSKLPYSTDYLEDVHFVADTNILYKETLTLGNIICGTGDTSYTYPVYADFYTLPTSTNNSKMLDIHMSGVMIDKINTMSCSHKTFILSGWAKADSVFIASSEDETEYLDYVKNRKFELRCEVVYSDSTTSTYFRQFDWRNTDWQYCAVPITLDNKAVSDVKCIIDYSGNNGTIVFTDLELKQGDFERTNYLDKHTYEKDLGHSEWKTIYKLEDKKLVTETIISKYTGKEYVTTYEYDKNGRSTKTTDYNGIVKENVYNDKGSLIKTLTYHKDEPASVLCEETVIDDKGNTTSEVNDFGEKIADYTYIDGTGITATSKDTDGAKTSYGYDKDDTLIQATTTVNGEENTNIYGYTLDTLTRLTHNGFDIKYSYDGNGRQTKVTIADNEYVSKVYGNNEELTFYKLSDSPKTYDVYKHVYDYNGNILDVYYKHNYVIADSVTLPETIEFAKSDRLVQNIYDIYGNLIFCKHFTNGTESIDTYDYDNFGQVSSAKAVQHGIAVTTQNEYDDNHSNLNHASIEIGSAKIDYDYDYSNSPQPRLQSITSPLGTESITYDKLGRVKKVSLSPIEREFGYLKVGDRASNLVSKVNFATSGSINDSLSYKYDKKGNITEIRRHNTLLARYKYDSLSRVIREDNREFDTTTSYTYDAGGNITCKSVYTFTLVDNLDYEKELSVIPYTYPISGWRDKLVSYNGESFAYDNLGNPTTYRNKSLVWSHGRQLDSFGNIAEYKYNPNGIRTTKVSNGFTTSYYLNGNKIVRQQDNLNTLDFYYGADGISGFHITSSNAIYNGTTLNHNFYYKKSLQGDIIGIVDSDGVEIVKYVYDAWGNHKAYDSKTGVLLDISSYDSYTNTGNIIQFIASKNPFRYRGYYYDYETGLYYLNSRYYDPEIGRFINADDIVYLCPSSFNGLNLYTYCIDNPINLSDKNGKYPKNIIGLINRFIWNKYPRQQNQVLANNVIRFSHTESLIPNSDFAFWIFDISTTVSIQKEDSGVIYGFIDNNNGAYSYGAGLNLGDVFGFEISFDTENFFITGINTSISIGRIGVSGSIGIAGLGFGIEFNLGSVNLSINATIGWGTLALVTILSFIPGFKLFSALFFWLALLV